MRARVLMTFGQQDRVSDHWLAAHVPLDPLRCACYFWRPPKLLCSILRVVRTLAGLLCLLWPILGHLRNICSQRISHWSAVLLIFVTCWWADRWISKSVVAMIDTREHSRTLAADISKMMEYFQKVIPTIFQDYPEFTGVSIPSSIKLIDTLVDVPPYSTQIFCSIWNEPWSQWEEIPDHDPKIRLQVSNP